MTDEISYWSIRRLREHVRDGALAPSQVVERFLERIDACNDVVNAYVTLVPDRARNRARELEDEIARGEGTDRALLGVPVALKDLEGLKAGVRNTFGSRLFEDYVPDRDHEVVRRLEEAGAIVLGKTNTPEFGHKTMTDNLLFGSTGTPFHPERTSGGSSGGSAAAVAAGMATIAQGSDAGGSLRIPASACGVCGFKPSYGLIPQDHRPNAFGQHAPFQSIGPIARSVEDLTISCGVMSGTYPPDPFTARGWDRWEPLVKNRSQQGDLSVAYSADLGLFPIDSSVRDRVEDVVSDLRASGVRVEEVELAISTDREQFAAAFKTMFQVKMAALAQEWEHYEGLDPFGADREKITRGFVRMMEQGRDVGAVEYLRVGERRTQLFDAVEAVFSDHDLLITPTLGVPPFDREGIPPDTVAGESIDPEIDWFLTWPFNITGHPAVSIPAGLTAEELPVGIQVVGRRLQDPLVLAGAALVERVRPWENLYPPRRLEDRSSGRSPESGRS